MVKSPVVLSTTAQVDVGSGAGGSHRTMPSRSSSVAVWMAREVFDTVRIQTVFAPAVTRAIAPRSSNESGPFSAAT
jgi:hypothetical protein